jgi:hypothetical protein
MQCPIVQRWDDLPAKRNQIELQAVGARRPSDDDQAATIRKMHSEGASLNSIQREVFGYTGGAAFEAVKTALGDTTTTTGSDTPDTDDLGSEGDSSNAERGDDGA